MFGLAGQNSRKSATAQVGAAKVGRMAHVPAAQQVGGYQMPSIGVIGGLAGVGGAASVAAAADASKKVQGKAI